MPSFYTQEQKDFLFANYKGITTSELAKMFNARFGTDKSRDKIKSFLTNHKLKNGVVCRFPKGHVPANKGKKGYCHPDSIKTQFKKGHIPVNHRPVGSERVDAKQGYLLVKVAEPNVWKPKHIVVWEKENGPIPKGYKLLFADQDRKNVSIDNLVLVSFGQMAVLNKRKLIGNSPECNKSSVILASLLMKIFQKQKKANKK